MTALSSERPCDPRDVSSQNIPLCHEVITSFVKCQREITLLFLFQVIALYIWICLQGLIKFQQWLNILMKQKATDWQCENSIPSTNTICGGYYKLIGCLMKMVGRVSGYQIAKNWHHFVSMSDHIYPWVLIKDPNYCAISTFQYTYKYTTKNNSSDGTSNLPRIWNIPWQRLMVLAPYVSTTLTGTYECWSTTLRKAKTTIIYYSKTYPVSRIFPGWSL